MIRNGKISKFSIIGFFLVSLAAVQLFSQQNTAVHTRGKLWETLLNYGFIGDDTAWEYWQVTGIGFYPGFHGYTFPNDEELANGFITDANFHNFRSGPWIIAKDASTLVPPDYSPEKQDFLIYHASLASGSNNVLSNNPPFQSTQNFNGTADFNPLLPEEMNYVWFHTGTGVTVKQRSMAWSFPDYDDFIIYDYIFKNTGELAIPSINQVLHHDQTLEEVWIVFHSGLQVSTKGMLNFHYKDNFLESAAPAGGFGYHPRTGYSDYYAVENDETDGKGLLYYSYDYNGGREPTPWDDFGLKNNWETLLTVVPGALPELQDPACFGFMFLYRTPPQGADPDPFEADPTFFNIYSDEGDKFQGKTFDSEGFGIGPFSQKQIYDFARHSKRPPNEGNLYCWYTSSFGPYTLAPGDSVRLIVAEVAGSMDLGQVLIGDPDHWFPDSSIADIRRNAEAARNAVKWGFGAVESGIQLAGDVPESPPAPNCTASNASFGSDTAIIAISWDLLAEESVITDGSGNVFYDGATDLSGYRIYRGIDKRGIWEMVEDIPKSELANYWVEEIQKYQFLDKDLQFGFEFSYYVEAYNSAPRTWVSANGTVVNDLGELKSDDYNRTPLIGAKPGPVSLDNGWDVFVTPNPYVEGDPDRSFGQPTPRKIEFRNLPEMAVIKIFSVSGDLVRVLSHGPDDLGNLFGSIAWDQRSESGLLVAPGLYIYVVESETEGSVGSRFTGKLMLIR